MPASVANEPPQFHINVLVIFHVSDQRFFIDIIDPADQANVRVRMRLDVIFEVAAKLEVGVAQPTCSHRFQSILVNLR